MVAAYLAMRAIDEIEDHEELSNDVKFDLLSATSELLKDNFNNEAYQSLLAPYAELLPEVSLRLADWLTFCPEESRKLYRLPQVKWLLGWQNGQRRIGRSAHVRI